MASGQTGKRSASRVLRGLLIALSVVVLLGGFVENLSAQGPAVRFAVIGDYGFADTPAAAVAALVASWNPDFVITTGDNNYFYGEASTIDDNIGQYYHAFIHPYRGRYGPGASVNRFFPTLGNHDWEALGAQPYLDYFTLPGNERYYDVVQGPVHLFALDSDYSEPDGVTEDSIQAAWLQGRLAASTARWKVVYMHHAPYSSGSHGSALWMRWPFAAWSAHAVLAGHDHIYERVTLGDFPYFVNGLGGASRYVFDAPIPGSQLRYNADFGAMLVEASEDSLAFQFVTRAGLVVDRYTLYASPGAHVPAAPGDLTASAISGREIRLSWRDNASNESGFRLGQSESNEAFVPVATLGGNVTSHVVGGLAPLTTYSYRVIALNAAGESAPSPSATAQTLPAGPPPAPSQLTARAVSSSQIDLAWTDGSSNESGFTVEQAVADSAFSVIADLPPSATTFAVTGLTPPVTYHFRVRAHNPDGVSPYSNTMSLRTAFVDLLATMVSNLPAALTPGSRFAVTSTIANEGTVAARSSKTRFYLSADPLLDTRDLLLLGGGTVSALAPGAAATGTAQVRVPSNAAPGAYYVLGCADDTKGIAESDENNNCRASTSTLMLGQPDLVATAVGDPPLTVARGTRFVASDSVRNQGAAPAPSTKVRYYLSVDAAKGSGDRLLVGVRSVPALVVGASATGTITVTAPTTTPPGDYWFFACADDTRLVTESDETNNCRAATRRLRVAP